MIILAIFSIFVGYFTRDSYLGMGSPFTSLVVVNGADTKANQYTICLGC